MTDRQRWDRRYAESDRLHDPEPSSFLRSSLPRLPPGRALVLAMGEGRNAVFLARHGYRVTGVDVSPVAVFRALRFARAAGVGLGAVVADLECFELGRERWDVITNFRFLDRPLFPRIVRALRPGGVFVLEHFSAAHPSVSEFGPRDPAHLLAPDEVLTLVAPLEVLLHEEGTWDLRRGPAGLVRLLARKAPS